MAFHVACHRIGPVLIGRAARQCRRHAFGILAQQRIVAAFHQRLTALSELPASGRRRYVALYEVRDPGNLGTVIRTADAAGCDGVILIGVTCDPFSVEAVRATMGSR